ncbi:MAG: glycosyltransferase [Thermosphaera sp.]
MLCVRKFKNVNPLLSVIIINYNSEKFFEIVRMSIKATLEIPIPKEIIVIDNGSTDSSRSFLVNYIKNISEEDGFYCSTLKLFLINKNIGFQNAINVAIRLLDSASKYLMIVNNDFVINSHSILSLIRILERVSRIGLIQGKILRWDCTTIDSVGCIITEFGDWLKLGHGMSKSLFDFPLIVSYVHAACFICRREVFSGFYLDFLFLAMILSWALDFMLRGTVVYITQ